ncbi:MAG TPA: hypothetical protein VGQ69_00665 [Gemmatimonadales bacterium]|jgi:hypothetical protein|nr:hypothetical protein [Gemmatimonadales bacterium]
MRYSIASPLLRCVLGLTVVLLGCSDTPSAPQAPESALGNLAITTSTTGTDIGQDGYQVFLDGDFVQYIGPNDLITLSSLSSRKHLLKLGGILPNCWRLGPSVLETSIPASGTARARFEFACTRPNTFLVTTRTVTAGRPAPDSLPATVSFYDGRIVCPSPGLLGCVEWPANFPGQRITLPANGAFQQTLHAQKVQVALTLPANCSAPGGSSQKAATQQNGVVRFSFEITCD